MNLFEAFSTTQAEGPVTDEGYRAVLRRKQITFWVLLVLGIITALVPLAAKLLAWSENSESLGFFSGMGVGIVAVSIVLLRKQRKTLKNAELLHKERIAYADERNQEIARRAWAIAGAMLLIALYLVGIIGGIFYPVLHYVLGALALVFCLSYSISYWILRKRM